MLQVAGAFLLLATLDEATPINRKWIDGHRVVFYLLRHIRQDDLVLRSCGKWVPLSREVIVATAGLVATTSTLREWPLLILLRSVYIWT